MPLLNFTTEEFPAAVPGTVYRGSSWNEKVREWGIEEVAVRSGRALLTETEGMDLGLVRQIAHELAVEYPPVKQPHVFVELAINAASEMKRGVA